MASFLTARAMEQPFPSQEVASAVASPPASIGDNLCDDTDSVHRGSIVSVVTDAVAKGEAARALAPTKHPGSYNVATQRRAVTLGG